MTELIKSLNIKDMIYTIRGQQVMLDSDLAVLYGYEVKALNQQVKNNNEKFPLDFRFQLSKSELIDLRSKNLTANISTKSRSLPYAFTEQGIYMLATVLKGELATKQTLAIIRTFKEMRHYIMENRSLLTSSEYEQLSKRMDRYDDKLDDVSTQLNEVMDNFVDNNKLKEFVFLDGQKFEADEAYISIYKQAKQNIYIIDDYVSIKTLSHLKHKNNGVYVVLFTDNRRCQDKLQQVEIDDFNSEYPILEVNKTSNKIHDRFIVIDYKTDDEKAYLCDSSSKDAGNKICAIIRMNEKDGVHSIIDKLENLV
ncbi:MAG: ORF6N domain-containing protein [Erysipelotrichales bacterium]|nr:ORF6N domain-containing protein [Erysipelotrichales bacterium]